MALALRQHNNINSEVHLLKYEISTCILLLRTQSYSAYSYPTCFEMAKGLDAILSFLHALQDDIFL